MRKITMSSVAVLALGLAACGSPEPTEEAVEETPVEAQPAVQASATLMNAEGVEVGTVTASETPDGVMIAVNATNMPPGEHGVHVHTTGTCEAPDFTSAGGHWNPEETTHGLEGDDGQHAGDMPNLEVSETGMGTLEYTLQGGATFAGLMDEDGSAFIVHEGADDQTTDPSGDSGSRYACGVFAMN
ncbi:Cu-Zn family superoxide dismutase [Altererythrobacter atlanticus]|uniref:Superoxide dismutase-like protein YojM n=1 Tax=Croceibacterium atlanticum TaxID=1267766 RepID=A0A0F7KX63_9SPHN|nr:superoxide dismutase family protein [Croceibacterium atlanticum]AKH43817.1 Superoxide dismutase-like protein YojM precursor [Croceibacterium atlanticum]MBB5733733.1 Cu-Zn family superoxide dismutase [Croceibacterium atlanticum]